MSALAQVADFVAVRSPPHQDEAGKLIAQLDRVIALAGDRCPSAVADARACRDSLATGDRLTVALLRHHARETCAWIEGRLADAN